VHRGYLANVEKGERLPNDRQFAEIADSLLATAGLLARLWDFADAARHSTHDQTHQIRVAAAELAASTLTPVITGDIVFVPYISAADTVAYMRMSRRAFLATGGLATASLTSGLFHRDELATADAIASDILARVLRTPWNSARQHAADLHPGHHVTAASVDLLGTELHNDHDAGARWCAAYLLADIWGTPEHPANASAATALEAALADEPLPTLRTAYGRALSRKALVS
jgi:hypothetical protein